MAHSTAFRGSFLALAMLALGGTQGCHDGPRTIGEQEQGLRRAFCENGLEAIVVKALDDEYCDNPDPIQFGRYRYQITFEVVANDPRGRSGRFPDVGGTFLAVWSTPLDTDSPESGEEGCYHNVTEGVGYCTEGLRREPHLNLFILMASQPVQPSNTCVAVHAQPVYRSYPLLLSDFTPQEAHDIIATDESCGREDLLIQEF